MLLVSWNVAGRKTRQHEQADRVLELEPDVVCLQEVTPATADPWLGRLADAGLSGVVAPLPAAREGSRPLAVLTASRNAAELVPVADAGLKLAVTPLGNPLAVKATAPVKPPDLVIAIVTVPFEPRATESAPGDAASEKSCVTAVVVALTGALAADCFPDAS